MKTMTTTAYSEGSEAERAFEQFSVVKWHHAIEWKDTVCEISLWNGSQGTIEESQAKESTQ